MHAPAKTCLLFAASAAWVLTGSAPASAQVVEMKIFLPSEDDPDDFIEIPDGDIRIDEFFNRSRCACDSPFEIEFFVPNQEAIVAGRPVEIWFGNDCADQELRPLQCAQQRVFGDRNELDNRTNEQFLISNLADPLGMMCGDTEVESNVYAMVDETGDGSFEIADTLPIFVDQNPPPEVDDAEARGSEGGFVVEWDYPSSRQSDLKFFNVLCAREDGSTALDEPSDDPFYETPGVLCNQGNTSGFDNLDPEFVCGKATAPDRSVRVGGLENGVNYRVKLITIDPALNPTEMDLGMVTPAPAIDFWEQYKDEGGGATGGYCSVGGDRTGGALALAIALTLLWWRQRRRRGRGQATRFAVLAAVAVVGAAILWPATASAQQEYLDELTEDPPLHAGEPAVKWNMELRFAPYVPDVDGEFDGPVEGPFARTYGEGPMLMTKAALERFFWYPYGQLGVSFGLGFFTTGADVFAVNETTGDIMRDRDGRDVRVKGERTNFRIVPIEVAAVYRLTEIDKRFHVPVVPYAKLGFAYYLWSVTRPDGSTSEASTDPNCDLDDPNMDCDSTTGRGGSLGVVATLGLALRAERIDSDAAVSLRNDMGIEHAGFFVELALAAVDGFGASSKLSVGDHTIFGGVNFEF